MATLVDITCCICEEVYDLEERKPRLLPCSHTFCSCCLQQMKTIDNNLCPVCRESWEDKSVDSLPFIRQLVGYPDKIKSMTIVQSSVNKNICNHSGPSTAWCEDCTSTLCTKCLEADHKSCNWVNIEKKTSELSSNLGELVIYTRSKLTKEFIDITTKNNAVLTNIMESIEKLQRYAKMVKSFLSEKSRNQRKALKRLEKYERIPQKSTVTELTTKISETLSLLDDPITEPTIPRFVVPDSEEPAHSTMPEDVRQEEASAALSTPTLTSPGVVRSLSKK